jgi:hypothetical protein
MLVLHLGAELCGLKDAFAIPDQAIDGGRNLIDVGNKPLVEEGDGFRL